jgi:hypothetical protein
VIQTKTLIVLGTDHRLQGKNFLQSIDDPCYRKVVEDLIHGLDFVFEEASGHAPTHAELLAGTCGGVTPIRYLDVDPSKEDRDEHGLSAETGQPLMVDLFQSPPCFARTEFVDKHAAREEFWLKRIRGQDFISALMICGHAHCLSFAFRLKSAGFNVQECVTYFPYERLCGHVAI